MSIQQFLNIKTPLLKKKPLLIIEDDDNKLNDKSSIIEVQGNIRLSTAKKD